MMWGIASLVTVLVFSWMLIVTVRELVDTCRDSGSVWGWMLQATPYVTSCSLGLFLSVCGFVGVEDPVIHFLGTVVGVFMVCGGHYTFYYRCDGGGWFNTLFNTLFSSALVIFGYLSLVTLTHNLINGGF